MNIFKYVNQKFKVGDHVMIVTEALMGQEGTITKILNDNLQNDPNGSTFIVENENTSNGYMMNCCEIALINHEEDEKNKTGYYTEAAQEILSRRPLFKAGDIVTIKNDMGPVEYVIKESKRVDKIINGGIYPVYQYQMVIVDGANVDRFHEDVCMCEEYDLVLKEHNTIFEKYFTEGIEFESSVKKPMYEIGDIVSINDESISNSYVIAEIYEYDRGIGIRYEYGLVPIDNTDDGRRIKESNLLLLYHDKTWEAFYEGTNIGNGLVKWIGKLYNFCMFYDNLSTHGDLNKESMKEYWNNTIPPEFMEHILESHSLWDRIDVVLDNPSKKKKLMDMFGMDNKQLNDTRDHIRKKINANNMNDLNMERHGKVLYKEKEYEFTDEENEFIRETLKLDKVKDHFPKYMTYLQIMRSIKEAYENAHKINDHTVMQPSLDRRTGETKQPKNGQRKYRGESKNGLLIEFWYDFDLKVITSAYPLNTHSDD